MIEAAIKAEAMREAAEIARSRIEPLLPGDDTEYNEMIEARNVRSRFTIKDILARADEYERQALETTKSAPQPERPRGVD